MKILSPTLKTDMQIHGVFLVLQFLLLLLSGAPPSGSTPLFVFPFAVALSIVTIQRQSEALATFQSRQIFIPSIFASFIILFCLLYEMAGYFWAYQIPRLLPVPIRILWVQGCLFLLLPEVFPLARTATIQTFLLLQKKGYFKKNLVITCLIAGLIMWLLRSQAISSDGYDWIRHSFYPVNWTRYLRESLSVLVYRDSVLLLRAEPYLCITVVNIVCGMIAVWLSLKILRFSLPKPYLEYSFALLLSCTSFTQLFFGNIEVYAIMQIGIAFFIYSAYRYWNNEWAAWRVGAAYALFSALHLSAGWWFFCFLAIPYVKKYSSSEPTLVLLDTLKMLCTGLITGFLFVMFVAWVGYDGNPFALWKHFTGDEVMFAGSDAAMFHSWKDYITWEYYRMLINEFFYLIPAFFILSMLLAVNFKSFHGFTAQETWFFSLMGFYIIYALTWHADRPIATDWDLFSGMAIPFSVCIGFLFSRIKLLPETVEYLLYQTIVFSGCYLILQIIENHLRIEDYWPIPPF